MYIKLTFPKTKRDMRHKVCDHVLDVFRTTPEIEVFNVKFIDILHGVKQFQAKRTTGYRQQAAKNARPRYSTIYTFQQRQHRWLYQK